MRHATPPASEQLDKLQAIIVGHLAEGRPIETRGLARETGITRYFVDLMIQTLRRDRGMVVPTNDRAAVRGREGRAARSRDQLHQGNHCPWRESDLPEAQSSRHQGREPAVAANVE